MNVITNKCVGLKCLIETKIQILYDYVDHTRFYTVEMGCQIVQLLSAFIVGPTMFADLTPASSLFPIRMVLYHFNRYLLGLVSTYLCSYHRTEEFIIMLANYVVS